MLFDDDPGPTSALAWFEAGLAALSDGASARALEALTLACRCDPELVEAHVELGVLLARTGRDREAVSMLERAIELGAEDVRVHRTLAEVSTRLGDLAAAARAWRHTLARGADARDAQEAVGVALSILFLQGEAVVILQHIAATLPSAAEHAVAIGRASHRGGNVRSARAAYDAALVIDPSNTRALVGLGRIHLDEQRYSEATSCFERAVALDPSSKNHVSLAIARHRAGDEEGARAAWLEAARLSPDDEHVRRALAASALEVSSGAHRRSATGDQSILAGDLGQFLVPDLLQLLATQRASGLLVLESATARVAFTFRGGALAGAVTNVDPAVHAELEARIAAALAMTLTWTEGQFAFYRSETGAADDVELVDTQHALLDAIRRSDERMR